MKLRNKKTGEIVEVESCNSTTGTIGLFFAEGRECDRAYESLAELNSEWEDYEEPKEYWTISGAGYVWTTEHMSPDTISDLKQIGNIFKTEEEAERAVEKLKAWKRLRDEGFEIKEWRFTPDMKHVKGNFIKIKAEIPYIQENMKDLDLLFNEEEE